MNNNYNSGRPMQGLLTMLLVSAVAIAVAVYAYVGFIKPAFESINTTFEQVQNASTAR